MQKLAGTWFDSKFEIKRVLRFLFLFFFGWFWFFFGTCFSILFTFIHVHLWGLKPYITQSILVECFSLVFWNTLIVRRMELFDRMTMGIFHQ